MNIDLVELGSIESALRTTQSVGSVVGALWALARAQLPRVEATIEESAAYLAEVEALLDRLVGSPLERESSEQLLVVLGPERSFCGTLATRILEQVPETGTLGLVGDRLVQTAERIDISRPVFSIRGPESSDDLGVVAAHLAKKVLEHADGRSVRLLFPRGGRALLQTTVLLSDRAGREHDDLDHFSPIATIVADALHELLEGLLHVGLANAWGTEIRWRLAATERAKQAIDERRDELERARRVNAQEQITRELGELTAAFLSPKG